MSENNKKKDYLQEIEEKYKKSYETLQQNGFIFKSAINIKMPYLAEELPIISKLIGVDIKQTNLIKQVLEYLKDTQGKHLLLLGNVGTGKTMLATQIIPIIINTYSGKVFKKYKAVDLFDSLDEAKKYPFVIVDDFGTEEKAVVFGNKRDTFAEWVDSIEGRECFCIATSNLNAEQIKQKYDMRTYDRLRGLFKVIQVNEKSMRN